MTCFWKWPNFGPILCHFGRVIFNKYIGESYVGVIQKVVNLCQNGWKMTWFWGEKTSKSALFPKFRFKNRYPLFEGYWKLLKNWISVFKVILTRLPRGCHLNLSKKLSVFLKNPKKWFLHFQKWKKSGPKWSFLKITFSGKNGTHWIGVFQKNHFRFFRNYWSQSVSFDKKWLVLKRVWSRLSM